MRLKNQVVLVTGGASGLGRAIVDRCLGEGAKVAVFDRSEARLNELTTDYGDAVCSCLGDVRVLSDHEKAVANTLDQFGQLDCAIGNAGIWDYGTDIIDLPADQLDAAFDEIFHVNVKGYLYLAKAGTPALAETKGSLIYTISNAGFYTEGGGPLYTASKHAAVGLVKQLAFELAPHIRVNGVAPGGIHTDLRGPESLGLSDRSIASLNLPERAHERVPLARLAEAAEYAAAYIFFAARDENVPATGSILNYDGGFGIRGLRRPRGGDDLLDRLKQTAD